MSLALALGLSAPRPGLTQTPGAPAGPAIEKGSTVRIEYTVTDEAGKLLDTNKGGKSLQFTHGRQEMLPGVERQLLGMHSGEEKKLVVTPEEGYGPIDPAAQTEIPREMVPLEAQEVGKRLLARNRSGPPRVVMVKEVKERTVVLDLNHPLAGKTLLFDVKVIGVDPPQQPGLGPTEPVRP
ncbi:MAG TPA: peptidylprolyl isomerase [Methylomirabilota bacterium]|nr:peptidylprolyl isomerase [Methylomirabilota bacterium]